MDMQSLFDKEFFDEVSHDISYEVQMAIKTIGQQLSTTGETHTAQHEQQEYFFTTNFYTEAEAIRLTEADAIAVYNNGTEVKKETIMYAYTNYEIGIKYTQDHFSGKPIITSIWKHEL